MTPLPDEPLISRPTTAGVTFSTTVLTCFSRLRRSSTFSGTRWLRAAGAGGTEMALVSALAAGRTVSTRARTKAPRRRRRACPVSGVWQRGMRDNSFEAERRRKAAWGRVLETQASGTASPLHHYNTDEYDAHVSLYAHGPLSCNCFPAQRR